VNIPPKRSPLLPEIQVAIIRNAVASLRDQLARDDRINNVRGRLTRPGADSPPRKVQRR
jgi:hypothetical protein